MWLLTALFIADTLKQITAKHFKGPCVKWEKVIKPVKEIMSKMLLWSQEERQKVDRNSHFNLWKKDATIHCLNENTRSFEQVSWLSWELRILGEWDRQGESQTKALVQTSSPSPFSYHPDHLGSCYSESTKVNLVCSKASSGCRAS